MQEFNYNFTTESHYRTIPTALNLRKGSFHIAEAAMNEVRAFVVEYEKDWKKVEEIKNTRGQFGYSAKHFHDFLKFVDENSPFLRIVPDSDHAWAQETKLYWEREVVVKHSTVNGSFDKHYLRLYEF